MAVYISWHRSSPSSELPTSIGQPIYGYAVGERFDICRVQGTIGEQFEPTRFDTVADAPSEHSARRANSCLEMPLRTLPFAICVIAQAS